MLRVANPIQTSIIPPKTPYLETGPLGAVVTTKQMKEKVVPVPRQDVPTPVTTTHTAKDQSCCPQCWIQPPLSCHSFLHAHILVRDPHQSPEFHQ